MTSRVFRWLRAADLQPDNEMVDTRTKVVETLDARIRASEDYKLLIECITAAVGGCERLGQESLICKTLLECIGEQQPAFDGSLSASGLHLRMLCCLTIGELFSGGVGEELELLAASLVLPGIAVKPNEAGRHLNTCFEELGKLAHEELQTQAVKSRERKETNLAPINALKTHFEDPPTFNKHLLPALLGLIKGLDKQREQDREELEVMWWLYNGFSVRLGKLVAFPTPSLQAAMAVGCEIADLVNPPATAGIRELVGAATARDRTSAQLKAKPIAKVLSDLGVIGRELLLPVDLSVGKFVLGAGVLLPLTWLCIRLDDSGGATGWEAEFEAKTGLQAKREFGPAELATQVFMERQAQRTYQLIVGERA